MKSLKSENDTYSNLNYYGFLLNLQQYLYNDLSMASLSFNNISHF